MNKDIELEIKHIQSTQNIRLLQEGKLKRCCDIIQIYFSSAYDIYFHLYGIMMFEIFFYLYYIVRIEKKNVIQLIQSFAHYTMHVLNAQIDLSNLKEYIFKIATQNPICNSLLSNFENKEDADTIENCIHYIYCLNLLLIVLTICHYCIYRSVKKIGKSLLKTLFFMLFCGVFEYLFFICIIMNYKIISKEESLCYFLNEIKSS